MKPVGVKTNARKFPFQRKNSLFRQKIPCFAKERGIGCKLLNSLDNWLQNLSKRPESGEISTDSLLFSLFSGKSAAAHLSSSDTSSIPGSSASCTDRKPSSAHIASIVAFSR